VLTILFFAGEVISQSKMIPETLHFSDVETWHVNQPNLVHVEPVVAVNPRNPEQIVVATRVVQAPFDQENWENSWSVFVFASADVGEIRQRKELPDLPQRRKVGAPWLAWGDGGILYLSVIVTEEAHVRIYRSRNAGQT